MALSVIVITKNEAKNIERCLKSVEWADEIIVVDSGSTDETIALATQYTNHIHTMDWQGFGVQKQRALAIATCDWILNLDADEVVSDTLKEMILRAISSDGADAYRMPIRMSFYNKVLRYSGSPSRHVRLFKREGAVYSKDVVHEKVILPKKARIGYLSGAIIHYCYRDVTHALAKMNRYSSISARVRIRNGNQLSFFTAMFSAGWMFFRCLFLQLGLLDGKEGLILAILKTEESYYRGIKQLYRDNPK